MKELFEKHVHEVYVSDDQHSLFFVLDWREEIVEYPVSGDCCSESWWADIVGVDALLGQKVIGIEVVDMPEVPDDGRTRQEHDLAYGYKLKTTKGYVDLVFRNSSNGYYGGELDKAVQHDKLPPGLSKITKDWRVEDEAKGASA
jgi:hypothetical protein